MSLTRGRTARIAHECDTCYWTPSLRGVAMILPGHRYLEHVAFPGDEGFEEGRQPARMKECGTHAMERDGFAATLYGICGSYCCGVQPCLLPAVKGSATHQCICKRCMSKEG